MLQNFNNLYRKKHKFKIRKSTKLAKFLRYHIKIVKFKMLQSFNNLFRKENVRNISLKLGKVLNWQSY